MRAWTAVGLEVAFFVLAFGVRSWVQLRRTGSSGLVLPGRGAGAAERVATALFVVGLVALVAAPVADISGLGRVGALQGPIAAAAGTALAVVGIGLCLWAQLAMGSSWRIGVDAAEVTELVTVGPFARVRNPIFSAMLLAVAGFFLLIPNVVALVAVAALLVGLEAQVRWVEEPYLRRVHDPAYDGYARQAGRFLPGIGR